VFRDAAPSLEIIKPLREWKPDGIVALLFDREVAKTLIRMRKPLVDRDQQAAALDALPKIEV